MGILDQLGLNSSIFFQFFIAGFAFFALSNLLFVPYLRALEQREHKTKGGEELAAELQKEASELRSRYEAKARELSSQVKTIFDSYRSEAYKEYETIIGKARDEANTLIESTRNKVAADLQKATQQARQEAPAVSRAIIDKLLSKSAT